jgi:hypothetical protein
MSRYGAVLAFVAGVLIVCGIQGQTLAVTTQATGINSALVDPGADPITPATPAVRERAPTGNPLWAVPLASLSATRERPIFSPSRRPLPPAVAATPYVLSSAPATKPVEPDRPPVALVGTIVGEIEGIGIFVDQATSQIVRIRTGQGHAGWVLRSVQGREATFDRDQQTVTLALPAPGAGQGGQPADQPAIPPSVGTLSGGLWMDGDGQMISPPPGRR